MYVVYKITNNKNNKIYIGSTQRPKARWTAHKLAAKNPKKYNKYHLYAAMHLYGVDNFSFEIIDDSFTDKLAMEAKEVELIKKYNTTDRTIGYNSVAAAGAELAKFNLNTHLKKIKQPCCKIDVAENILEYYESYQDAARKTNLDASVIRKVCKGVLSRINNNIFRDLDENNNIIHIDMRSFKNRKPIIGINIISNQKSYFSSILEASKSLSLNRQSIQKCIDGNSRFKHVGNYIFRLLDQDNNIIENNIDINMIIHSMNKLILINDIYYSKVEICEKFNIKLATLNARLREGDTGIALIRPIHTKK